VQETFLGPARLHHGARLAAFLNSLFRAEFQSAFCLSRTMARNAFLPEDLEGGDRQGVLSGRKGSIGSRCGCGILGVRWLKEGRKNERKGGKAGCRAVPGFRPKNRRLW
jgi:hypothetical protein